MRVLAAAFAALAVLATGCGGGEASGSTGKAGKAGRTDDIAVAVADGKVQPPTRREQIAQGDRVKLIVTSDQTDEVHLHGYNIEKEVEAGKSVTFDFVADQTGVFEVETHDSGLQLLQLVVR